MKGSKVSALIGMSFYKGTVEKINKENGNVLIKLDDSNYIATRIWVKKTDIIKIRS
jgi:hypothetical protein